MRNSLFLSLLTIPLLVACGGDGNNSSGGGGSGGGGSDLTIAELGDKVVQMFCAGAVDCHRAEAEAECIASTSTNLDGIEAAVNAGTVTYHPEKVDACLAKMANFTSCSYGELASVEGQAPVECQAVFEGTIADGAACSIDEACISGNCEAVDPMCSMQCCASKCAPKVAKAAIGESCVDASCDTGGYCQYVMGMPTTCAAKVAEGQPCTDFSACLAPAMCDLDFMTGMGTCKKLAAHGAACDPNSFFTCDRLDDYCDATSKTCVTKKLPGDSCVDADCVDFADCDAMDKCAKQPVAGATCDAMNGPSCLNDLSCTNGKCELPAETVCP